MSKIAIDNSPKLDVSFDIENYAVLLIEDQDAIISLLIDQLNQGNYISVIPHFAGEPYYLVRIGGILLDSVSITNAKSEEGEPTPPQDWSSAQTDE